jgi:hypothetical protein
MIIKNRKKNFHNYLDTAQLNFFYIWAALDFDIVQKGTSSRHYGLKIQVLGYTGFEWCGYIWPDIYNTKTNENDV